jgi:osmotically-inducible protein OsmY
VSSPAALFDDPPGAPLWSKEVSIMRQRYLRHSLLLALACTAGLTVYGCNRDYESDDAANEPGAATDQYGETGTGTGVLPMDKGADDSAIKDRIVAQLQNDPRFGDVDIDIDDGVVTIDGKVSSQADLDAVQQMVRQSEGVRDVKLNVQIESKEGDTTPTH